MFDDLNNSNNSAKEDNNPQNKDNSQPPAPASDNSQAPAAPANISTPPVSAPLGARPASPEKSDRLEDIFADSDGNQGEVKPAVFQPKQADGNTGTDNEASKNGSAWQKIAIPLVLIIGIGLLGVGAVFGYRLIVVYLAGDEIMVETENPIDTSGETDMVDREDQAMNNNEPGDLETDTGPIASPPLAMPNTKDSDNDGLTDAEEAALGTNTLNVDTDDDGLFDREEVKVYNSNPLDPDTDGDGYTDGSEVQAGYNPVGEGKLYEIRQ